MRKLSTLAAALLLSISVFCQTPLPTVPAGFTTSIVAEGYPGARHLAINNKGGIYIKLSKLKDGKGIIYLEPDGTGKYIQKAAFGNYPGTGIIIKNGYLYASSNDDVFRYKLDPNGKVINKEAPEKIVTGLVNRMRDNAKTLALDNNGNLYVNVGSYIGSCLIDPQSRVAPNPCPLLDSVGGIWQFKASKTNQTYADAIKYATGFKHNVALDWNSSTNSLFILEHGRDQFNDLFPAMFTAEQNGKIPAETMYEIKKGAVGGWPYSYYDPSSKKQILAPEYGGDGKKEATNKALTPAAFFPAHLGPNGLLFYTGKSFPAKYRNGAFIAFHARNPEMQKGQLIGFQPFKNGKPAGEWEVFADNFTVEKEQHKPCGLAMAPDGSLIISDDAKGVIYRIAVQP